MDDKKWVINLTGILLLSGCFINPSGLTTESISTEPSSEYIFETPSIFQMKNTDRVSITLTHKSGPVVLEDRFLKRKITGTAECDLSISGELTINPSVEISDCTGNGIVQLSYGEDFSHSILVNNTTQTPFTNGFAVELFSSGNEAIVADGTKIYRVNLLSGLRELVKSDGDSVGSGESLGSVIGLDLNKDETQVYATDRSGNKLVKIRLSDGFTKLISDNSIASSINFAHPTRLVVKSDESIAYVADRDRGQIIAVDITTGVRTALAPSTGTSYGISFGTTEDNLLFIGRDSDILYSINLSDETTTVISNNSIGDGISFSTPHGLKLDPSDNDYVYVLNLASDELLRVSLITGYKTKISNSSIGAGPEFLTGLDLAISPDGKKAYVIDSNSSNEALMMIDLSSGNRSIASN